MRFTINTQAQRENNSDPLPVVAAGRSVDHYLIDTENMGQEWVELLNEQENAVYHIFYTEKSSAIPIEWMTKKREQMKFIKCYTGANALDFQLVTQLGYMLATFPEKQYHIVSKETGYDAVIKFWTERGIKVDRQGKASEASMTIFEDGVSLTDLCSEAVTGLATADEAKKLADIIRTVMDTGLPSYKVSIHTQLVKEFTQARGSNLYHACKDIMEQLYLNPNLCRSTS